MYCSFTRNQSFPLALIRVSSKPRCSSNSQTFPFGFNLKPSQTPNSINLTSPAASSSNFAKRFSTGSRCNALERIGIVKMVGTSVGFRRKSVVRNGAVLMRVERFSSGYSPSVGEQNGGRRGGKPPLPWLAAAQKDRPARKVVKMGRSAETTSLSSWGESVKRMEEGTNTNTENVRSSWKESEERLRNVDATRTTFRTSWDEAEKRSRREDNVAVREPRVSSRNGRSSSMDMNERRDGQMDRDENHEKGGDGDEAIDDPRWDRIRNRAEGFTNGRGSNNSRGGRYERPEVQRWNNQDNWGKKTWKEASESTVPKMVGECVYGVGPVLAALSVGRREFYVLYVQEGLELNGNSRKKKDKRGFEKVLKIAEKLGLSLREIPKHDLNMIADNRPHQGLVLDASPLEMICIKDLEPVSSEREKGSLWVALDEVTDPQNLGAIVRSAYYFGASGVVVCAKNSAPLSGVVSKASAGSLELMELRSCKNMMQFLTLSIENGWRVLGGSVSSRAVPLNQVVAGAPTILVLGSEGTGLRPLVERSCTDLVRIPGNIRAGVAVAAAGEADEEVESSQEFRSFMAVESLNVSVAAGVLIHHLIGNYNDDRSSGVEPAETLA